MPLFLAVFAEGGLSLYGSFVSTLYIFDPLS